MTNKLSLNLGENKMFSFKRKILQNNIIDRGSKYTTVGGFVESKEDVALFINELLKDKYFRKSTHNTYAFRIKLDNGSILEGKNDDGEVGAGNCILGELQREDYVNSIVVVTRYFGGIHLNTDRFKNVINATKNILKNGQ